MKSSIFILSPNNTKRYLDWNEINQLRKDILWIYDENINQINTCFVPTYSFKLKYWEYLTVEGDSSFSLEEKQFITTGILVTILCFCVEYNCIESGNQKIFSNMDISNAIKYISNFKPNNKQEERIKEKIILGLEIAKSITEKQKLDSEYKHKDFDEFIKDINEIGNYFISDYYKTKLNSY